MTGVDLGQFSWSEHLLFALARVLYRSEVAHSAEMKQALQTLDCAADYRSQQASKVIRACDEFGVRIADRVVLDLGCNDGALTRGYLALKPERLIGVDVDHRGIERARGSAGTLPIEYRLGTRTALPIDDESVDTILCFDVFEHIADPRAILSECRRALRSGGQMLIGTWGWRHPFAPHLWAVMPVPWAHVIFSERKLLRTCRRVFHAPWYVPNMYDVDESGRKKGDRYTEVEISTEYLNKFLIRDFEEVFASSGLRYSMHLEPFSSRLARWTGPLLRFRALREYLTGYLWVVLAKPS